MAHSDICPVCESSGKYKRKECHGCDGKGWITVGTDCTPIPYIYPQPYYPPMVPFWQDYTHAPITDPIITTSGDGESWDADTATFRLVTFASTGTA